mmetsp:Transcript_51326/g.144618  ORF Transcript_51326/g.144618 Transcript_51326/m.144618 type:complete len:240 (-) Transcript_51326:587-1306(-)
MVGSVSVCAPAKRGGILLKNSKLEPQSRRLTNSNIILLNGFQVADGPAVAQRGLVNMGGKQPHVDAALVPTLDALVALGVLVPDLRDPAPGIGLVQVTEVPRRAQPPNAEHHEEQAEAARQRLYHELPLPDLQVLADDDADNEARHGAADVGRVADVRYDARHVGGDLDRDQHDDEDQHGDAELHLVPVHDEAGDMDAKQRVAAARRPHDCLMCVVDEVAQRAAYDTCVEHDGEHRGAM